MNEQMETYHRFVEQEDTFNKQLKALEMCQYALYDHIYRYGGQLDKLTAEEVLLNVHQMEATMRLELLHLRLAKAFLAHDINQST